MKTKKIFNKKGDCIYTKQKMEQISQEKSVQLLGEVNSVQDGSQEGEKDWKNVGFPATVVA